MANLLSLWGEESVTNSNCESGDPYNYSCDSIEGFATSASACAGFDSMSAWQIDVYYTGNLEVGTRLYVTADAADNNDTTLYAVCCDESCGSPCDENGIDRLEPDAGDWWLTMDEQSNADVLYQVILSGNDASKIATITTSCATDSHTPTISATPSSSLTPTPSVTPTSTWWTRPHRSMPRS